MRYSVTVKFLAVLLTALSLVAALGGASAIVAMEKAGLYVNSLDELQDHEYDSIAKTLASESAELYLAETMGDVPYILRENLYANPETRSDSEFWLICLSREGELLHTIGTTSAAEKAAFIKEIPLKRLHYAIVSDIAPDEMERLREELNQPPATEVPGEAVETPEEPENKENLVPEGYDYAQSGTHWVNGSLRTYYFYYYPAPDLTASVFLREEVLESSSLHILTTLYPQRYGAIAVLALGLIIFAAGLVFLFWSAGKQMGGKVNPSALNLLPLDLYLILAALVELILVMLMRTVSNWIRVEGPHPGNLSLIMVVVWAIIVVALGFMIAFAAQTKVKDGYIWKHSLLGRLLKLIWRALRFLSRAVVSLTQLLPVIWQWLLVCIVLLSALCVCGLLGIWYTGAWIAFAVVLAISIAVIAYGGYCFGSLMSGAQRMSEGDLSRKIPEQRLVGSFRQFAQQLNALSDTVKTAAENELRSERMKSELITNISHDIKTPLTSIINFVDLLQKPHSSDQQQEYLEVLSRQSGRMKKLIEDLLELSKASTGNLTVNICPIDAGETVNQALGEFSDKLESARLTPVFRQPEQPIIIQADGRLVWRVLSNLLSNAVKYALSDTRLYVELEQNAEATTLSLKNISREALNIHADELMERFVRGDTSRGSEGSGLGLNIAKSLMEVQGGRMELQLDGDLFKVTLFFPTEPEANE